MGWGRWRLDRGVRVCAKKEETRWHGRKRPAAEGLRGVLPQSRGAASWKEAGKMKAQEEWGERRGGGRGRRDRGGRECAKKVETRWR